VGKQVLAPDLDRAETIEAWRAVGGLWEGRERWLKEQRWRWEAALDLYSSSIAESPICTIRQLLNVTALTGA